MKWIFASAATLLILTSSMAPYNRSELAQNYVKEYLPMAIMESQKSGIPIAIKLGQALLETNYGQSNLVRKTNNHFGLKCKDYWSGNTHYQIDDDRSVDGSKTPSCFRSYPSAEKSYADHSSFLVNSPAYQHLFDIPSSDYRAWSLGLESAGYATDSQYAEKLISIINTHGLDKIKVEDKEIIHKTLKATNIPNGYMRGYFVYKRKS